MTDTPKGLGPRHVLPILAVVVVLGGAALVLGPEDALALFEAAVSAFAP